MQSAAGQLKLMSKRQPISRIIAAPSTTPALRAQLESVASIREFATRQLGLPDNGSYRSYADVGRPYVVWNVVAAPEFSVNPKEWCYPIVGCVAYRGYFVEARARKFAAKQRERGLEVAVAGTAAYSTLGHFDDPILNTMLGWDDVELASIVFHELTHQLLYVPNDASFNEALATTVEEEGVKRWLESQGRDQDLAQHRLEQQRDLKVVELLGATRDKLRMIYASGQGVEELREEKRQAFADLRAEFAALRESWGGHAPYETWFDHDINNAHLATVATYFVCVPGFERELSAVNGDLAAFYRRVRQLAKLPQKARDDLICGEHQG
jgi:predicted aminopeptidase